LKDNPASALGTNDVTALDMAAAYSTFANRGIRVPPVLVTRISRADGTVLYTQQHQQTKVLAAGIVDTLTDILQQAIERGTGTRAKLDRPAAGKTGTTDEYKNAWFAGYTPHLATAVWVGFPELGPDGQLVPLVPPHTPIVVTGGTYPAQIWQRFMSVAHDGLAPVPFPQATTTTTSRPFVEAPTRPRPGPMQPVPSVVGKPVADAVATLRFAGFVVQEVSAPEGPGAAGVVRVQSPAGGSSAPRGSTVTVEVSQGKKPKPG
jgi:penicillin-binding protein 1A